MPQLLQPLATFALQDETHDLPGVVVPMSLHHDAEALKLWTGHELAVLIQKRRGRTVAQQHFHDVAQTWFASTWRMKEMKQWKLR